MKTMLIKIAAFAIIMTNIAWAQETIVDFKVVAKDRILSKTTEKVTTCSFLYVGPISSDCAFSFEFTVISRVKSQKWLESKGAMIPGSLQTVEEVIAEKKNIHKEMGTIYCRDEHAARYCNDVLRKPYLEMIGLITP